MPLGSPSGLFFFRSQVSFVSLWGASDDPKNPKRTLIVVSRLIKFP
ncbi:MAG: hypothetical protein HYS57_01820 [Parcubacteria group bacterium]|nr:hypothetical protein [Parcubacteria group bacterium]